MSDIEEMCYLYFERMYSFEQIVEHFKGKYSYPQVRTILLNKIKGVKN